MVEEVKEEGGEKVFTANIRILDEGKRIIEGIVSTPKLDRQNEVVMTKAITEAIPYFMELPIMTVRHTERPGGLFEELRKLDDGRIYARAKVKDTPDADDIWSDIKKGELNAFSIHGRRRAKSGDCSTIPPIRRVPCYTHSMYLDAITLCSQEPGIGKMMSVNDEAVVTSVSDEELIKAVFGETFLKSEDTNSNLIHQVVDMDEKKMEYGQIEKSESDTIGMKLDRILSKIDGLIKRDNAVHDQIDKCSGTDLSKGEEDMEEKDKKPEEEEKIENVEPEEEKLTKAHLTSLEDVISKAVDELAKIGTRLDGIEARVTKVEEEPLDKAVEAVLVLDGTVNPAGNAGAIGKFQEKHK